MVSKVMWYWPLLCAGLFVCNNNNAAELRLQLQQQHIELGQAVNVKLIALNAKSELAKIDLSPLYENFAVTGQEMSNGEEAPTVQKLSLELYPRRSGTLIIPPLALDDARSREQTVVISNAMVQDTPIVVDLSLSSRHVWQRQQILATVEVKSAARFFDVEAEPFRLDGFEVRPFVMRREPIDDDSHYRSRMQLGWAIFPLISGQFTLELPMIRYVQGGLTQRRFILPRAAIQVRPLPAYIPPNMPVAKVHVASSVLNAGLLRSGHMAYWNITLSANGTLAYWLPPILRGVRSTNQVEYLPAKSNPRLHVDVAGVRAQVTHEVPFKPRRIGPVNLQRLKVQYFDPDTGRIETIYHQPSTLMVWNVPLIVVMAVLITLLLLKSGRWIVRQYSRYRLRESALRILRDATNAQEIALALRRYALAEGWAANLTLADFLLFWQRHYRVSTELGVLLHCLSRHLYGGGSDRSLAEMQSGLLQQLRCTRQRRRGFSPHLKNSAWDHKNIFITGE